MPRITLLLPLLLSLTACVSTGIKSITNLSALGSDEILIVGKIKLVPKFHPSEQTLPTLMFGKDQVEGKAFVAFSNEFKPLSEFATFSGIKNLASVEFRKTFMVAAKRTKPLIFSGSFFMISGDQANDHYLLPGGMKFNYNKKDRAIYIGTIEYHRNDYDEITEVKILNEYKQANKIFKKVFGNKIKLKRIKPVLLK